jgi:hypothetical protein
MVGLLVVGIARGAHKQKAPSARRQGLAYKLRELFQALVGVVLPDYDDYDALLLNAFTSHAAHAITRGLNTQEDRKSDCTFAGSVRVSVFVVDHSLHVANEQS